MDLLVLDASVALAQAFEDEADELADAAVRAVEGGQGYVPRHWPSEVANAALVAVRAGRLEEAAALALIDHIHGLPIVVGG